MHRLEEAYQSQIEFYKDSIKSFKMSKKLLENDFINRIQNRWRPISGRRPRCGADRRTQLGLHPAQDRFP